MAATLPAMTPLPMAPPAMTPPAMGYAATALALPCHGLNAGPPAGPIVSTIG